MPEANRAKFNYYVQLKSKMVLNHMSLNWLILSCLLKCAKHFIRKSKFIKKIWITLKRFDCKNKNVKNLQNLLLIWNRLGKSYNIKLHSCQIWKFSANTTISQIKRFRLGEREEVAQNTQNESTVKDYLWSLWKKNAVTHTKKKTRSMNRLSMMHSESSVIMINTKRISLTREFLLSLYNRKEKSDWKTMLVHQT